MRVHVLEREQVLPVARDEVFAFFSEARNLEQLTPTWLSFEVLTPEPIVDHAQARREALARYSQAS